MYLPQQETASCAAPAPAAAMRATAVMDPLRYPLQNGEVLEAETVLSNIEEGKASVRVPGEQDRNPKDTYQKMSTQRTSLENSATSPRLSNAPQTVSLPESSRAFVSSRNEASSSSHPSNLTVLNINFSNCQLAKPQSPRFSTCRSPRRSPGNEDSGQDLSGNSGQTTSVLTRESLTADMQKKAVSDFASCLTSALLETNQFEAVDLNDPEEPVKRQPMYNDLSFKPSSPCDDDESGTVRNTSTKRSNRRLPRTPAPSIDQSGCTQLSDTITARNSKLSLNLNSLHFSLPESEVYEPEPVDFPSSPTAMRGAGGGMRLAEEVLEEEEEDLTPTAGDEDAGCMYSALATPPAGMVAMRKTQQQQPTATGLHHKDQSPSSEGTKPQQHRRKKLSVTDELLAMDNEEEQQSVQSLDDDDDDDAQMTSHEDLHDILTPDDIDTPDEMEESIMERLGPETPVHISVGYPKVGGSLHLSDGAEDDRSFRAVVIQGIERRIDMQVIEPYKKVLSHGGYLVSGEAIIVFSACFLPDRSRHDYDYVMDHLFMYVLTTLDQLIAEDYVLVYLHGATTRANMPSFGWLKRCYQMIDRRLRKNLQVLYLVHPTFWVKTVVVMIRPFVSAKFSRKLRFVTSLRDLASLIPMEQVCIPSRIKQYDDIRECLISKDKEQLPGK